MISSSKNPVKNFDYMLLSAFLEENSGFLLNARLQKIQQPTRQELVFSFRNIGETRKFYVNISPTFFHVCFINPQSEKKRQLQIPKSPPMFCMLLRKYLEGSKIAKVIQPENERILEFYFETYDESGEKIFLCLAIELMGKHSNVVLYNYDTNVIIGCAHNVGSDKSRQRELVGGLPYAYPPKAAKKSFLGLSSLLSLTPNHSLLEVEEKILLVNNVIDNHFADLQEQHKIKNLKSKLITNTKNKLKKISSSLEKIQKQTKTQGKADLYRKKGDLIMANLFNNKDFSKEIEVIDYETNSPLVIKLDESKTLKENANNFYKLYSKAKTSIEKSQEMIKQLKMEKDYLEQVLYSIEAAQKIEDLLEIEDETSGAMRQKIKEAKHIKGGAISNPSAIELFDSSAQNPFSVFIGKNNKQNDRIVKMARDEDLWFHVHNCAGSHVLLRVESGQKISDEMIFECAKLAKQYSSAKNSSKVGVIYTFAKNLKKPPGTPLGYVTYKNEKEIIVD